ncbi:MAG: TRAP transporter small permease [Gammaproteobacteria bacterium]|nr:TRAP transporter small permease [Gammaproteobacteria bacterium]
MQLSRTVAFVNNDLPLWFVRIAYSYLSLIILLEVIRRYIFSASSPWGEMTARYAFVYLSYIAAAEAIRLRKHIRITLIIDKFSPRLRSMFDLYIDLLTTVLAVLVIYYSLQVINIQWSVNIVMESANVNLAFAYAALPIGWGLLIIRIAQTWYERLKHTNDA